MSKTPAQVIQEELEALGPVIQWESDLHGGHAIIEALEKHGYRIIRHRVSDAPAEE